MEKKSPTQAELSEAKKTLRANRLLASSQGTYSVWCVVSYDLKTTYVEFDSWADAVMGVYDVLETIAATSR
jgi:hypothetical protein